MNAKNLCAYVSDKCPRISAISQFSTCTPSVAVVMGIYNLLLPLANMDRKDVDSAERTLLKNLKKQLKQQFTTMIKSVGTLSNGNAPLFALSGVANKSAGKNHNEKLDACEFKLVTTHGKGVIYVVAKAIPYAVNYTIYYGPGAVYDPETWKP